MSSEEEVLHYSTSGCPLAETLPRDPTPFFSNGDLNFKAHDVGWLVSGIFALIATWCSVWLILKHLSFFYHPSEQRMIVRILFMPVIYAWCSFFSYYFVHQALYWQLVRDCYEAIIIGSFFYLLLSYLSNPRPTSEEPFPQPLKTQAERTAQLRASVKNVHLKKFMWPMGWLKWRCAGGGPGEGEAFLWLMRVLVGQYVIIRPLTTLVSVISEYTGYYCLASWSPKFLHVWCSAAITISVTVAMYVVLQLYVALKVELEPYSPILKFASVKLVVFLTFWQESSLTLLVTLGVIKNRTYWSAEDIVIGISGLLSCFEMMLFAFLHVKAFSYLPYRALAKPVSLDHSDSHNDYEKSIPPQHLTFEEWSEWDNKVKLREKEESRLAKMKLPKQTGDLPISKPDGSPILQQTKKWQAFVKCIRITDLGRELRDETKWVVRGGKVEMTQDLLEADRKDDHEALMGSARPSVDGKEKIEKAEKVSWSGGSVGDLDAELRRLRESRPVSLRGTTIDKNGNRVLKKGGKHAWSKEEDRLMEERQKCEDAHDEGEEEPPAREGWWGSMMDSLGRASSRRPQSFRQLPRQDSIASKFELRPTSSPLRSRLPALPPTLSYTPDTIPFMNYDSSIPLPPAHRFDSNNGIKPTSRPLHLPQPPQSSRELSHSHQVSRESEPSHDSLSHLPQTTLRPHSFIPPAQLVSRSPPPFAHFQLPEPVSPPQSEGLFAQSPVSREVGSPRAQLSNSPLAPPPAAFFSAGTAFSNSRGLPLGAAAPHSRA